MPRGPQVEVVVKHTVELEDAGENSVNSQHTRPGGRVQTSPSQVIWQGWSEVEEMSVRELGPRGAEVRLLVLVSSSLLPVAAVWWCCAWGGLDCCLLCLAGVAGVAGGALEAQLLPSI